MKEKLQNAGMYIFLAIASLISVFPLYWMAVSATNRSVDIIRGTLLPGTYLLNNWAALLESQDVGSALFNTFRNASLLTILSLLICSLAGYGFEVYHSKAKDRLMGILLLAMMVPFAATIVPLFRLFANMNLLNTTAGFMLPLVSTPFLIMLFRQSARSFPHDIIEAARIDGLNELQIFFRMFIPTMRPTYASAMVIVFMNGWNNYLWPRIIMITDDGMTMPMLVANLIAGYVTDFGVLMLAVFITTLPTVILFFMLQRYFAEGITGAVK